jgi:hypothetical protein
MDAAFEWIRLNTPVDRAVLTSWQQGYELSAYTGRPAVADGFLESRENVRRIMEIAAAAMSPSSDSLARLCDHYGADVVLVSPGASLYTMALLTDPPLAESIRLGRRLTSSQADRVQIQMMRGRPIDHFVKAFEQDRWRIYQRMSGPGDDRGESPARMNR